MLTNKLTDTAIRKAKHGEKSVKLSDGGGLYLELHPNGSRYWRMKYRYLGAEKRLAFGVYPEVTLAGARACRDDARKLIANGADPGENKKTTKAADQATATASRLEAEGLPGPGSFEFVARDWLTTIHQSKVSAGHSDRTRTRIRMEQDVFPWLGRRPIAEIEAPELLQCLRRVEVRGAFETTHRIKDSCAQVFRFGIATGACLRNPAADLKDALRPVPTRHHAAIIDPKLGGELLRDMIGYTGNAVTRAALALSALLLLRPGELRQLRWPWVDLDGATVTIPGELMKRSIQDKANGPPHTVPLAPQAIALFRDLQRLTGTKLHVFPSMHTGERPMSENTVNMALRRMGYDRETMTAHGFRAMARTMIAERLGVAAEVIEAQLAHAVGDALGRAYNRTQFIEQRRDMMNKWADYLDRLRDGGQIIPIGVRTG